MIIKKTQYEDTDGSFFKTNNKLCVIATSCKNCHINILEIRHMESRILFKFCCPSAEFNTIPRIHDKTSNIWQKIKLWLHTITIYFRNFYTKKKN